MAQTLQLRPYQYDAAGFLYERDRAMILAPVGAGKTAITLTAMSDMLRCGIVKRWLVLAPKRVCSSSRLKQNVCSNYIVNVMQIVGFEVLLENRSRLMGARGDLSQRTIAIIQMSD